MFVYPKRRFDLLRQIKKAGYEARMNAYEYYVCKKGFATAILLQPYCGEAYAYGIRWNREELIGGLKETYNLLKSMNRDLNAEILEPSHLQ